MDPSAREEVNRSLSMIWFSIAFSMGAIFIISRGISVVGGLPVTGKFIRGKRFIKC